MKVVLDKDIDAPEATRERSGHQTAPHISAMTTGRRVFSKEKPW